MARPPKSGLDWFRHETDASTDEKIEAMRSLYGNDGYAFYFILLERIYRTSDQQLDLSDEATRRILCTKVGVKVSRFEQMLETALARGLFDKAAYAERGILMSDAIRRRAAALLSKRKRMDGDSGDKNGAATEGFGGKNSPETNGKVSENPGSRAEQSRAEQSEKDFAPGNSELRNAEVLVDEAMRAYHLPPDLRDAVLAWIEIHDNRLPSQHDCRAIMNRCNEHTVETVTLAIRRMGNAGQKPVTKLDEYIAAETTAKARTAPPAIASDPEGDEARRREQELIEKRRRERAR
jgi:hypothetical protein